MIKVEINSEDLQADLQRVMRRLQQRKTLTAELSRILHHAVLDNFAAGGRPAWQPRKYPAKRNTALLQATGALRQSLTRSWDNNQAEVGTNLVYAAIHNFGGRIFQHQLFSVHGCFEKF